METTKWCLFCDEPAESDVSVCQKCGQRNFTTKSRADFLNRGSHEPNSSLACSECHEDIWLGQDVCTSCGVEIEWPVIAEDNSWFGQPLFSVSIRAEAGLNLPKQGGKGILKQKEFPKFYMSLQGWKIAFPGQSTLALGGWSEIVSYEENAELSGGRQVAKSPLISKGLIKTVVNYQLTGIAAIGDSIGDSMFNKSDADKFGGVLTIKNSQGSESKIEFAPGGFSFMAGERISEFHPQHWFQQAIYLCNGIGVEYPNLDFSTLIPYENSPNTGLVFPAIYLGGHGPNLPKAQSNICLFLSPKGIWLGGAIVPWSWITSFEVSGKGEFA